MGCRENILAEMNKTKAKDLANKMAKCYNENYVVYKISPGQYTFMSKELAIKEGINYIYETSI
jgi:flagellar motility protein MotE (MotC chaperone)